jgi:hypothetical protein
MYHFDISSGASPEAVTVKVAPLEPYEGAGLPWRVKALEAPFVKSTLMEVPKAGSAGQLEAVRGLQVLKV